MLVLTRKIGEKIIIGDDITITVLSIQNAKVRIGIDAPRSISVHRQEVYDADRQQDSSDNIWITPKQGESK